MADLRGVGELSSVFNVEPTDCLRISRETTFETPGTYFIAVRVTAQEAADVGTDIGCLHNIARARVTVTCT